MLFLCKKLYMKVLLIADESLASQFTNGDLSPQLQLQRISTPELLSEDESYDACIDLLFVNESRRIAALKNSGATLVIVSAVISTLKEVDTGFVRINGWPTFIDRTKIEGASLNEDKKIEVEKILAAFGKEIEWLPDMPGFVSPRVVASIINEAYYALDEGVSSREEIDVAMKLGTNYPFGPFEWNKLIGANRIHDLLEYLGKQQVRYQPARLLIKEALA
jgi:3-hydroxybutyryl-CoA dehydrogenase